MTADIYIADQSYRVNLNNGVDLSIGFDPRRGPLAWGVSLMRVEPVRHAEWVGLVREGAAVNFCDMWINPHGQGTHTECVGHVAREHDSVQKYLTRFWFPAYLHTADVVDGFVDLSELRMPDNEWGYQALLVRTRPNKQDKRTRNYSGQNPPCFKPADLGRLSDIGVMHMLTDLPSVDPEEDGGALAAHKAFFYDEKGKKRPGRTITEFIYAPDEVLDGPCILHLQAGRMHLDAVPSRPVIYPLLYM